MVKATRKETYKKDQGNQMEKRKLTQIMIFKKDNLQIFTF